MSEVEAVFEAVLAAANDGLALECSVAIRTGDEDSLVGEFDGPGVARLLDRQGELIEALQVVAVQAVRRVERGRQVVVDAGGYRARHRAALERLAARAAAEAIETGDEIELDPMNPHDRRIVHVALKEIPGVATRSEGEEPRRRIIVEALDDLEGESAS